MNAAILQARGLSWETGGVTIVDRVDFSVARGELVGVIGPNGAGKTTLLRLMAGILMPSAGDVELEGRSVPSMDPRSRARRIAFMTQDIAQVFPFTVMEIVLMGRYPHVARLRPETPEDHERARHMLSYVGMGPLEERTFNGLSGGERQLVLFAKALAQDTDVLLLDEPSSSLDIHHEDRVFSMAQELAREGRAVAASVHNLAVAAHYCSRLVLLEKGRVAREGPPELVLRSDILDRVYGTRTVVAPSLATGSLTVSVVPEGRQPRGTRVHLIGGAGSAVNLTRELTRRGCSLSGGIAHEQDSDEKLWRSLGVPLRAVGAFARISDEEVQAASSLVEQADLTILCVFPVGVGNVGNLRLAARARRLLVLQPGPEEAPRVLLTPEARALFNEICSRAAVLPYEGILAAVQDAASG